jgi:hypothetical protein
MPRRELLRPEPAAPPTTRVIHPTGVYRLDELTALLKLKKSSLAREVRERRLRVSKRCGTYFFLGEEVLAWLRGGQQAERTLAGQSSPPVAGKVDA